MIKRLGDIRRTIVVWFVLVATSLLLFVHRASAEVFLPPEIVVPGHSTLPRSTGVSDSGLLKNPLGSADTLPEFLVLLLRAVELIAFPFIVLFMVYGGFKFIAAQGNPEKINEAKRIFLWVLIGALIVLGAEAISQAINATVSNIRG